MNTTTVPNNEALDRALIQCLRLFAQHGRKVRSQKPPADENTSDNWKIKEESQTKDKESSKNRIG